MNRKLLVLAISILFVFLALIVFSHQSSLVFASLGFVKNPQPIFSPNIASTSWDSQWVATSFISKQNIFDNMWYAGHGLSGDWQLGFAKFDNSLNQWTRSQTQLVFQGSSDLPETNASDPFLIIDDINHSYKMWYNAISAGQYEVRYATSSDGLIWTKYPYAVLKGGPSPWDMGGVARGKSVVYNDGRYHMWYSGGTPGAWRIGYATSQDGIHWDKQNGGQPVITKTKPWEFESVSYPDVILKDGVYHMWYATGSWDLPTSIVYARSTDGINWDNKPALLNPVFTTGNNGTWDDTYVAGPDVHIDGKELKMWYSGFDGNTWKIGHATAPISLLDLPPPTNKVIIVPGFGASWNSEAIIKCTIDTRVGTWSSIDELLPGTDPYNSLKDALISSGLSPNIMYYDWRNQAAVNAATLSAYITTKINKTPLEQVHVVGHSLGGLVSRTYFESDMPHSAIDHLFLVGSPFSGTALAYPAWSGGDVWWNNFEQRVGMTLVLKWCGLKSGKTDRQVIRELIPSVQNLLPRNSFLMNTDGALKEIIAMNVKNNLKFLPTLSSPLNDTVIGTLSGNGIDTLDTIIYKNPTKHDVNGGNWLDGKPFKSISSLNGDGTVLVSSSQIDGIGINKVIAKNHAGLINSPEGILEVCTFLKTSCPVSLQTTQAITPASALIVIGYPADITLTDPSGLIKKDTSGFVGLVNPKPGEYQVAFIPKSSSSHFAVAQFLSSGKVLWKDYTNDDVKMKQGLINYDPENPVEDALR